VTARQFPGLQEAIDRARGRLGVERPIDGYLVQTPKMAISSFHLFGSARIFIPAGLVVGCLDTRQVDFFLGREIASMTSRGGAWSEFLLPYRFLPWAGAAYERARERTHDRCGLVAAGDLEPALRSLVLLSAGAKQSRHVDLAALDAQRVDCASSVWMSLLELASPSPFLSSRIAALRTYVAPGSQREAPRSALAYALVVVSSLGFAGVLGAAGVFVSLGATPGAATPSAMAATLAARLTGQGPSCGEFDPDRVYLQGSVGSGSISAVTELEPGTRWCGALPDRAIAPVVRRDGTLAYEVYGAYGVFAEDVMMRTANQYRLLGAPEANDEIHKLSCDRGYAHGVRFWPDRDGAAFECDKGVFRDDGEMISTTGSALALGYDEYWLRCEGTAPKDGITVIGPDGEDPRPLDVFMRCHDVIAARAVPDGFLVAHEDDGSPHAYKIRRDGSVESLGVYATLDGHKGALRGAVLDARGTLFDIEQTSDTRHEYVVVRKPLEPDEASVAYREDGHPVHTFMGWLVTGP
jgi:hypothetical protein